MYSSDIIEACNSTSRYTDDLFNIDKPLFEVMVNQIHPPERELIKANATYSEAPFLGFSISVSNGFVLGKFKDLRDDFDFDKVNFPFLDGEVPVVPLMEYSFRNL